MLSCFDFCPQCSLLREIICDERLWRPLCEARWGDRTKLQAWMSMGVGAETTSHRGGRQDQPQGSSAEGAAQGIRQTSVQSASSPMPPSTLPLPASSLAFPQDPRPGTNGIRLSASRGAQLDHGYGIASGSNCVTPSSHGESPLMSCGMRMVRSGKCGLTDLGGNSPAIGLTVDPHWDLELQTASQPQTADGKDIVTETRGGGSTLPFPPGPYRLPLMIHAMFNHMLQSHNSMRDMIIRQV